MSELALAYVGLPYAGRIQEAANKSAKRWFCVGSHRESVSWIEFVRESKASVELAVVASAALTTA
jgi:hypothetical protein